MNEIYKNPLCAVMRDIVKLPPNEVMAAVMRYSAQKEKERLKNAVPYVDPYRKDVNQACERIIKKLLEAIDAEVKQLEDEMAFEPNYEALDRLKILAHEELGEIFHPYIKEHEDDGEKEYLKKVDAEEFKYECQKMGDL
jgi:glutamyl-tRNA reductase